MNQIDGKILCMGRNRALINEPFLIGIKIYDISIDILKVILPFGLKIKNASNYRKNPKKIVKENAYIIERSALFNPNLATIFLIQEKTIPESKFLEIAVEGYQDKELIGKTQYSIQMCVPEIDISIEKIVNPEKNSGHINIMIKQLNDILFTIRDIDILAFNHDSNEEIELKKKPMKTEEYINIIRELPDVINPDQYIGEILFPNNMAIDIKINIKFVDILGNTFNTFSNVLPLTQEEIPWFQCNPLTTPSFQPLTSIST